MEIGRFAPSPSGRMHLGNVFSALLAWLSARSSGGEVLLRIEDLDPARSKEKYTEDILDDFRWLGLTWDRRSENQSRRGKAYEAVIEQLEEQGVTYPCYCSRDQIHAASAPHALDGRVIYPGTCRHLTLQQRVQKKKTPSLRLRVPDETISLTDGLQGAQRMNLASEWGDFIIRRADGVTAYQLAVVVDDSDAGVTQVVRGRDLLPATPAQLYLYRLLGRKPPVFYHVPMVLAADGRRLSKRDRAIDMGMLRKFQKPEELIGFLAWNCGLISERESVSARELIPEFSWDKIRREDIVLDTEKLLSAP